MLKCQNCGDEIELSCDLGERRLSLKGKRRRRRRKVEETVGILRSGGATAAAAEDLCAKLLGRANAV